MKWLSLFLILVIVVACGGSGGSGTTGTDGSTGTTGTQELQYAPPGQYTGRIYDFPATQACTLTIQADPNDPSKPKPVNLNDPADFNAGLGLESGTGIYPSKISGHSLITWGINQSVFITQLSNGRVRIWALRIGTVNETSIDVTTTGVITNPPPPAP